VLYFQSIIDTRRVKLFELFYYPKKTQCNWNTYNKTARRYRLNGIKNIFSIHLTMILALVVEYNRWLLNIHIELTNYTHTHTQIEQQNWVVGNTIYRRILCEIKGFLVINSQLCTWNCNLYFCWLYYYVSKRITTPARIG